MTTRITRVPQMKVAEGLHGSILAAHHVMLDVVESIVDKVQPLLIDDRAEPDKCVRISLGEFHHFLRKTIKAGVLQG